MKIYFAVLCLFLVACASDQPADIAIRDATVVDVAGDVLVPNQTVGQPLTSFYKCKAINPARPSSGRVWPSVSNHLRYLP